MKSIFLLVLSAIVALAASAQTPGFHYWSAAELKGYSSKLAPKVDSIKYAGQPLGDWGNHTAAIAHREGSGSAELHETMSDVFVVQSGEATLIYGGELVNGKPTAPHEVRGTTIKNGQTRKLGAGDIVHIPFRTPHQLLIEKGKEFTYFFVKVREK